MLNKDSMLLGFLLGLAIPFVGYAILLMLFEQIPSIEWLSPEMRGVTFRTRTTAVLAICLNIIPFRYYQKQWYQRAMRGVLIATFLYVGFWTYQFSGAIFS